MSRVSGESRKSLTSGGTEDNVSAPSSFTANAHNELYAILYYTGKGGLLKNNFWANTGGGATAHTAPFESAVVIDVLTAPTFGTKTDWMPDGTSTEIYLCPDWA